MFFNHSTNVLLTNYSVGESVRTSTLQDASHFSNNCLKTDYFTYNSLCHNSSGSEVYIHLVDCAFKTAWKIPENYVMALEASEGQIDII